MRDELEAGIDCYILTQTFSDHSSTSFSSWLVLLNRGLLRAQSLLSAAGSQFGILSPTDSSRLCPGYIFVWHPPASAVLPLIYTGASLDWWLGRGSIYYTFNGVVLLFKGYSWGILTPSNEQFNIQGSVEKSYDIVMECDQLIFIYEHSSPYSPHTSFIGVSLCCIVARTTWFPVSWKYKRRRVS